MKKLQGASFKNQIQPNRALLLFKLGFQCTKAVILTKKEIFIEEHIFFKYIGQDFFKCGQKNTREFFVIQIIGCPELIWKNGHTFHPSLLPQSKARLSNLVFSSLQRIRKLARLSLQTFSQVNSRHPVYGDFYL